MESRDNKIKRLARHLININETNDPFVIAKTLGVHISICPLGDSLGSYAYIKKGRWIFINSKIAEYQTLSRVVTSHELGHAILHRKENCCFMAKHTLLLTSRIEREANLFAAELLITDDLIHDFSEFTIEQFSNCTDIPEQLIKMRLG